MSFLKSLNIKTDGLSNEFISELSTKFPANGYDAFVEIGNICKKAISEKLKSSMCLNDTNFCNKASENIFDAILKFFELLAV